MEATTCKYCNRVLRERDVDEDGLCKIDCGRKQEAKEALGIGKPKFSAKPERKDEKDEKGKLKD